MEKSKKSQFLTLSLVTTLIFLTPLLSPSFRSTYVYFIINVLIIVLGAEAGFLSSPSLNSSNVKNPKMDKNNPLRKTQEGEENVRITKDEILVKEKKIMVCANQVKKMIKKCSSTPSMFYIGSCNEDEDKPEPKPEPEFEDRGLEEKEEEEDDQEGYEKEELFVKAETFIVNFYEQLKMQSKEELWNNIHHYNNENGLSVY